jgi:4'-phosphopantetheinyl transferase EntD
MIDLILPRAASVSEVRGDRTADLFPVEEAHIARAVASRKREFATGRGCAREALARLGVDPTPIGVGDRGEPLWPAGYAGSITHCRGYRGSAVARTIDLRSIGIDAEPHERLPDDLLTTIAGPAEVAHLDRLAAGRPATHWDRLLFSAKESIYKALFPVDGRRLEFADAVVELDPDGSFSARVGAAGPGGRTDLAAGSGTRLVDGRWMALDGLLLSAVVIEP